MSGITASDSAILSLSESFARNKMALLKPSHSFDHVIRVVSNALKIAGNEEGADIFILKTACLLHDIARGEEDRQRGAVCHAELGSRLAYDFLIASALDRRRSLQIAECIRTHRYRAGVRPKSIEARILYDADKLDSIGAVGIGRAFLFSGEVGAVLHDPEPDISMDAAYGRGDTAYREYTVKLRGIRDAMLTDGGKELALERSVFMDEFFSRLNREILGEL